MKEQYRSFNSLAQELAQTEVVKRKRAEIDAAYDRVLEKILKYAELYRVKLQGLEETEHKYRDDRSPIMTKYQFNTQSATHNLIITRGEITLSPRTHLRGNDTHFPMFRSFMIEWTDAGLVDVYYRHSGTKQYELNLTAATSTLTLDEKIRRNQGLEELCKEFMIQYGLDAEQNQWPPVYAPLKAA